MSGGLRGASVAPHDQFCPVCAFRGALQTVETATELSEAFRNHVMELIETPCPQKMNPGGSGRRCDILTYKTFDAPLQQFAGLKIPSWATDGELVTRHIRDLA